MHPDDHGTDLPVAIIPAAGKGSRLAPFPCPKELFPVGYQDYLVDGVAQQRPKVVSQYLVENLIGAGVKRIFLIVGDDKWDIMRYFGDGTRFGIRIAYLYQERLTGMPGALDLVRPWIDGHTVLFGMPDTIIEPRNAFEYLLEFHRHQNASLTLGLFPTDNPQKGGMVDWDAAGNVLFTVDKPRETHLTHTWGCACWGPDFTRLMGAYLQTNPYRGKEIVLGDVFNEALRLGMTVKATPFPGGRYLDIGTANELDLAIKTFHL
ncbi:MAG: nucleotidyltransferase family protein [Magnetococcales bacterium]|nr:nucleotidyltransferase family protein [Magnetococcales bacterium]